MKRFVAGLSTLAIVSGSVAVAVAQTSSGAAGSPGTTAGAITVRIADRSVHFAPALHAGFVRLHIVSTGSEPHHLIFWQLNPSVGFGQFDKVDASQNGNPFKLAGVIGGNGQLPPGKTIDIWVHIAMGRISIDDIPAGHGNGLHRDITVDRSGPDQPTPHSLGTLCGR